MAVGKSSAEGRGTRLLSSSNLPSPVTRARVDRGGQSGHITLQDFWLVTSTGVNLNVLSSRKCGQ